MGRVKLSLLTLAVLASAVLFALTYAELEFNIPARTGESRICLVYTPGLTPISNATDYTDSNTTSTEFGESQAELVYIPNNTITAAPSRRIMLCPVEVKVSILNSTHSYEYDNLRRVLINAERGDVISVVLKANLDPNLLNCVREALELESVEGIRVEYGLKLGSESSIIVEPGVKSMDASKAELEDLGGGLYKLTITVGSDVVPGIYRVELTAYLKIEGEKVDFTGLAEYAIYMDIRE